MKAKTQQAELKHRPAGSHQRAKPILHGRGVQPQEADPSALQRAIADPAQAQPADILGLQKAAGNWAVTGLIQARLMVGPVGDRYEQEADRVAEQVMSMEEVRIGAGEQGRAEHAQRQEEKDRAKPLAAIITPLVQRQEEEEEVQAKPLVQRAAPVEEELQAKATVQRGDGGFEAGSGMESRLAGQKGSGSPLPKQVRAFMEPRFGVDFSGVRVHTDGEAVHMNKDLNAQAFTHGRDIYLGGGQYDPGSTAGKRLLAHELTHVVQQGAARASSVQGQPGPSTGQDSSIQPIGAGREDTVQRIVIPYKNVHKDWDLAEKQTAFDATLGFSPPWVNGAVVTSAQATINALAKPQIKVAQTIGGQYEAEVVTAPVNIAGSEMWLPKPGRWRRKGVSKANMMSWTGLKAKKPGGTITVEVTGVPNHKALAKQIEAHENVHASDNARIINQILGRWDEKIHKAQKDKIKFPGQTAQEAEQALEQYIGGNATNIGTRLDEQWGQASDDYHATAEGKTLMDDPKLDERRGKLTFTFRLTARV